MAVYLPVLAVMASGGQWWQALLGVLTAVGAVVIAFTVSYRWGHHVGRLVAHPNAEQLLLRTLGLTLIVAAMAEAVHASAAVGAFLVGLTLMGETATRTRAVLSPLRDLFAAVFFLAIGLSIDPGDLLPVLPVAMALVAVTAVTKVVTGRFAAARDQVGRRGRMRAGTVLIARGEFSLVIVGLVGTMHDSLGPSVTAYVVILALVGPLLTRLADTVRAEPPRPPDTKDGTA